MTDRKKNQHKKNVSLHTTDTPCGEFQVWFSNGLVSSSVQFNPPDLEVFGERKKVAREIVIVALKHMFQISHSNIVRKADNLTSEVDTDSDVK